MSKPTVQYILDHRNHIHKGEAACVRPINHPSGYVSNTTWSCTSTVVAKDGDNFETLNTKYVGVN